MGVMKLRKSQAELPCESSTASFWHREPSQKLLGHRTTADLPVSADVIVIGSGITGAFTARELVTGGRDVVMLEAREACWGATGRNGGHCQPQLHGDDPEVARFELMTYEFLQDLIKTHDVPCDWHTVGGVEGIFKEEILAFESARLAELAKTHPDLASKALLFTAKEDLEELRVPGAIGAVLQPNAAKCWPYKLVAWVLEGLLETSKFNLQTKTPVVQLQRVDSSWIVHTARGQIASQTVVLATNGYTSHLLPAMTGLITPVRGQVCALKQPEGTVPLAHSHFWTSEVSLSENYLIHREPEEGGHFILGGERLSDPTRGVGVSRDDVIDETASHRLHRAMALAVKLRPRGEAEQDVLESAQDWTGIMGYSQDERPWVGLVPQSLGGGGGGLYISAGYTGHGMPVAAKCGIAVSEMILGQKGGVKLPEAYKISEERIGKARVLGDEVFGSYVDLMRAQRA